MQVEDKPRIIELVKGVIQIQIWVCKERDERILSFRSLQAKTEILEIFPVEPRKNSCGNIFCNLAGIKITGNISAEIISIIARNYFFCSRNYFPRSSPVAPLICGKKSLFIEKIAVIVLHNFCLEHFFSLLNFFLFLILVNFLRNEK